MLRKVNYVDNDEFREELDEYKRQIKLAKQAGLPKPRVPECIGEKILLMAKHISFRNCYIGYQYREDMVLDAVENCIRYVENIRTDVPNVFNYFTKVINHAFMRRIHKEKSQLYTKYTIIHNMLVNDSRITNIQYGDEETHQEMLRFTKSFEDRQKAKQKKKKLKKIKREQGN